MTGTFPSLSSKDTRGTAKPDDGSPYPAHVFVLEEKGRLKNSLPIVFPEYEQGCRLNDRHVVCYITSQRACGLRARSNIQYRR